MKRIIAAVLMLFASVSLADPVRVPGIWGFAVGSTQGTYFRTILEQANREQRRWEFQFEHRPGAGGAIAARTALDHRSLAILAHSGAFFARPYLYADTPYKFDQFRPVLVMGSAPAVLITRGKTLEQLIQQPRITLGTAGMGSSTHLMAETLKKYLKNSEVTLVHFRDTNEAYVNVLGGHIDATFEFLGDARAKATAEVKFVGLTGRHTVDGIVPLRNFGWTDMEWVSGIFAIYVPVTVSEEVFQDLRSVLLRAERHESVQALYRRDFTYRDPALLQTTALPGWYDNIVRRFRGLTQGLRVE